MLIFTRFGVIGLGHTAYQQVKKLHLEVAARAAMIDSIDYDLNSLVWESLSSACEQRD